MRISLKSKIFFSLIIPVVGCVIVLSRLPRHVETWGLYLIFTLLSFACAFIVLYFLKPLFAIFALVKSSLEKKGQGLSLPKDSFKEKEFCSLIDFINELMETSDKSHKRWQEETREKKVILESLEEGVIVVDADLNITTANAVGSKMVGISKRHLLGRPFPLLAREESALLLEKCHHLLKNCQAHHSILTDSLSLGEARKLYLDLIASPKEMGGAILILQNKSSNYKVLEMGKDFVANASHELRTPITIIKGFAETLQDLPEISPDMLSDITEKIVRNCERMDKLVKNLLTLADIENLPDSRFHECDLVSLVENCRHVLLTVYPDCTIDVEKNKERIAVMADSDILELAICNLLDNAAKYSHAPAQITISLESMEEEVKILIADKGIGIPHTDLEHIFERFYTVNKARSRRLGGAGLGLSLVKTIIERHEGVISVKSALSQGTSFTIFLPAKRAKTRLQESI